MNEILARFITEIVKPWELLNRDLSQPFSVDANTNDFVARAKSLAVSITHMPEAERKLRPKALARENRPFAIMRDLADSSKHGADALWDPGRQCRLALGAMFGRNPDALVRFLRNRITIQHENHKRHDFMECSRGGAKFAAKKLDLEIDWSPEILCRFGKFSNEITVIASSRNHVQLSQMQLEFVQLDGKGRPTNVDLNGTVKFVLLVEP